MNKLAGRSALVTGAGRGIGAAVVRKLAQEGAGVLAVDLDAQPLTAVVDGLSGAAADVVAYGADVTEDGFAERAIGLMAERFGGVDIIVNSAGYVWNSSIQKMSDEQWQAMLAVHATAPARLLRAALPQLRRRNASGAHKKVVNVSSISGVYGAATQLAYAAAKAAVIGMTKTLAKEWGRYAINVNCVAFGYIDTRLTQVWEGEAATIEIAGRRHKVGFDARVAAAMEPAIPLGRKGSVEEAAGAVFLLCLPEADYISGQVLVCDGANGG